jgi:RNA 3'-terminal phosphate cyclase
MVGMTLVRHACSAIYVMVGQIRRVRGVVFCSRISPTVITRVVDSAKAVLNNVISDVFISSDHYKGGNMHDRYG